VKEYKEEKEREIEENGTENEAEKGKENGR
jgi:hypothetical protein